MNELNEMNIGKQIVIRIAFNHKDLLVIKSKICKFLNLFLFIYQRENNFQQDKQKTSVSALSSS